MKASRAMTADALPEQRLRSRLGIHVYSAATIALGVIGLVWGDFASPWQPGQKDVPHALAYIAALSQLAGGVAVQWRRSAKIGLYVLTLLNLVFATLSLRRWLGDSFLHGNWLGFAEQLTLPLAPVIVLIGCSGRQTAWEVKTYQAARVLFGLCAVVFGIAHFHFLEVTTKMAPQWLPPGPRFWAVATGVCHLLAGIAIVTGIQAVLAGRLLTAMILTFGALVWAPSLVAHPTTHLFWSGNAINLAYAGAAWTVADAIASQRRTGPSQEREPC